MSSVATDFEKAVARFIAAHGLLLPGARVGVALSGGADSVALLAVMTALGYDVTALHCNFNLRGAESLRDEEHARATAATLGAAFRMVGFDVGRRRREHPGESVEMACRELRYKWFARMAAELGLEAVAVGHHRADRVETFMLNALRTTGLRGISAMQPRRGIFIRPLLDMTRSAIEAYVAARGLAYVTDHTNLEPDFTRNRLRLNVMPVVEAEFPGAEQRLAATLDNLDRARRLFDAMVSERRERYTLADGAVDAAAIVSAEPCPAELLFELLRDRGIDFPTAEAIADAARRGLSGLRFGPLTLTRGLVAPTPEGTLPCESGGPELLRRHFDVRLIDRADFRPDRTGQRAWFDARILDECRVFTVRGWLTGDRMRPFGLGGSRLLSDIFNDAKLSPARKAAQPVVCAGPTVIWLPGLRQSADFSVGPATRRVLQLAVKSE